MDMSIIAELARYKQLTRMYEYVGQVLGPIADLAIALFKLPSGRYFKQCKEEDRFSTYENTSSKCESSETVLCIY